MTATKSIVEVLEEREGRDVVGGRWGHLGGLSELGGSVAPFLDYGFLYHSRVCFTIYANLFGDLNTIRLRHKSGMEKKM